MICKLYVSVVFIYSIMAVDILTDAKKSFISKSISLTTLIGETVEFNCSENNMESQKSTTYLIWYKNEEPLRKIIQKNPSRTFLDASRDTLTITNVTNEDEGTYQCVTFNETHRDYSIYTLTVNGLPELKSYNVYTSSITASNGLSVFIRCMRYMYYDSKNYNNQNHLYFKDGRPLIFNKSDTRLEVKENFGFKIDDIRYEDNGAYMCVSLNKFRIDFAVTYLNVVGYYYDYRHPYFYYEIVNQTKHLNENFFLPYTKEPWFKNDKPFISSEEIKDIKLNYKPSKFEIKNLTFEDAGNYTCNYLSTTSVSNNFHYSLNVIDRPDKLSFRLFNSNINIIIGETFELKCHIFQNTENYRTWYSWKKNGEKLVLNSNTKKMYFEKHQSILKLSNLTSNESGIYECEAESYYHKVYSAYALTIPVTDAQKSFISKSISHTTLIGETVEFNCSENNMESQKSTTQFIWYKNEELLRNIIKKNPNRTFLDASGGTLTINNVTNEDAGTYKCVTFNQSHSDISTYTLTVNDTFYFEQVNFSLGCSTYVVIFLLIGAVAILRCVLWLRRKRTTTNGSEANKLKRLNSDREKLNADSGIEEQLCE